MLYRLLMFVNRMTKETRRLAIAANLDYRALETVAVAEPAEQADVIQRIVNGLPPETGKPNAFHVSPVITHDMHQFESLTQTIQAEGRVWRAICKADATTREEYLCAAREIAGALAHHISHVEKMAHVTDKKQF
jgi:hypothetical protein